MQGAVRVRRPSPCCVRRRPTLFGALLVPLEGRVIRGGGSGERGAGSARTQTLRREQGLYRVLCDGPERRHSHVVGLSQVSDGGCRTSRRAKLRILLSS